MARSGKANGRNSEDDPDLTHALDHRVRRRILRLLHASDGPCSPARLAEALDLPVSSVSYHMHVLLAQNTVEQAGEQQVRGAMEHFYLSTVEDDAAIQALLEGARGQDEG